MITRSKVLIAALALVAVVFMNGLFFVFFWQHRAMEKLNKGGRLNLYECCSAYTMNTALWMLWWPVSPAAAHECLLLHSPKRHGVVAIGSRRLAETLLSPKVVDAIRSLESRPTGAKTSVRWNGETDYALSSPEHRAAIAINPCTITKAEENGEALYLIRCEMVYAKHSNTPFDIGPITIRLQEGLLRHLQDRGWLGAFTSEFRIPGSWIRN